MINLGSWMNGILIGWGVDPKIANTFDEMIIAALLVILAIGLDYLCQAIFVGSMKKLAQHTHYQWDSLLLKRKVVHHLVHTIPGILVYALLPLAFIRGKGLLLLSQKICAVYIVFALLLAINGFILVFLDMYNMRQVNKNRPIKGFMQVLQVLLFFIGGIVIIAILIGKSPASLFAGLGASAAILMLVFKDTILGFVAGIQLSANDMLRPGDWITVPGSNANGIVQEITLNTVKIQNFDNTISTIPPLYVGKRFVPELAGHGRIGRPPCDEVHFSRPQYHQVLYSGHAQHVPQGDPFACRLQAGRRRDTYQFADVPCLCGEIPDKPSGRQHRS